MKRIPRFERALRCLLALQAGQTITTRWLRENLGLSAAQAKRDLRALERCLPVQRAPAINTQPGRIAIP